MDRHDYAAAAAAAAAFAQQQAAAAQQQFGFQQFQGGPPPPSAQPFLPHHPSMQFPSTYHQQLHHHGHLPYQQHIPPPPPLAPSPPPIAPHILPPQPFFNPWDAPPPPVPPPADADLQKRIDKLAEYAAKNGPDFEKMIREKQQDNPAYNFLFGAEGHGYYRYKLWLCTRPITGNFSHGMGSMNPGLTSMGSLNSPLQTLNPPLNPGLSSALNPALSNSLLGAAPPLHHSGPFPAFYDQHPQPPPQHSQPLYSQSRSDYEPMTRSFKGLSGPLPSDVAAELYNVLNNLTGTKESIKGAKTWFMQRSPFAPALAEALKDRVMALDDAEKQLHIIYLANDILFDSLQRRINPKELDNEALAFQPVLGNMLARIYHNPQNKDANQSRLQKILQFWASKEVYDTETIYSLEGDMLAGPPAPAGSVKESSVQEPSVGSSGILQSSTQNPPQWPLDIHRNSQPTAEQEHQDKAIPPVTTSQFFGSSTQFNSAASQIFATNTVSSMQYPSMAQSFHGSLPTPTPAASQLTPQAPNLSAARGGDQPPYPLFPPGLIPGMVRKMQIGSGVPYSPLSPLDIPTVIPPSTLSSSYILERVSKFFKEIGEVNPLENQSTLSDSIEDDEREQPSRTGGACIPPPPNLQVDADTGTLPDGSVEHKPGSTSTGRLGLGATADPNEMSQYDDVYSSYRKQRSSSYHTSMSARASAR